MSLVYIHPDNLHAHWDFVKQGLERIHDRASDRWKTEDVYWMLKAGNASLHIVNDHDGFVVLQMLKGWDGPECHVFAAYIVPGKDLMDEAFEEVKGIAKACNAVRVKFQSKRKGWDKRAAQLGYELGHVEYELSLR